MAPLITIGATIPVWRKPAMNVSVFQSPIGTSPIKRSPRGHQPLRRTMLVVTAVSSINTRRAGSSDPCSRIQRRRARTASARSRSSARRLFFNGDAVASEKPRERATASWHAPLAQRQDDLIERGIRLFTDERDDPLRVLLQWRSASSAGHWFASSVIAKLLHPPDRGTHRDVELFGCFSAGASCFHQANHPLSELPRIRSAHWPILRRINALDSLIRGSLGSPIHSRRDVL